MIKSLFLEIVVLWYFQLTYFLLAAALLGKGLEWDTKNSLKPFLDLCEVTTLYNTIIKNNPINLNIST